MSRFAYNARETLLFYFGHQGVLLASKTHTYMCIASMFGFLIEAVRGKKDNGDLPPQTTTTQPPRAMQMHNNSMTDTRTTVDNRSFRRLERVPAPSHRGRRRGAGNVLPGIGMSGCGSMGGIQTIHGRLGGTHDR